MKYIDSHAHLNSVFFKADIKDAISQAQTAGVTEMIMPSTTVADSQQAITLAQQYDFLYAAVGLHPASTFDVKECDYLAAIDPHKIVAVGEVGIDLYRTENPPLAIQEQVFEQHIIFAKKHHKPLIIHMRNATEEVYNLLQKHQPVRFVMHCFASSYAWALKFIELGGLISFSGIVTFSNAQKLKEVAQKIPLTSIISETDAPYLTPVPHRGKPNTPAYVKYTIDYLASIRSEDDTEVVKQIYQNTKTFFDI